MADDYSKSLDTQIEELQKKEKRLNKLVALCSIMLLGMFIIIIISSIFQIQIQIPVLRKAVILWGVFWFAALMIFLIKYDNSVKNLRSMMAKNIGIEGILNQYLDVELFDPERSVDKEIVYAAGIGHWGYGHNYIKGKINNVGIETSYVHIDEGNDGPFWYRGQLSYLKNKRRFPEKVLLIRKGNYRKYGIGIHYYEVLPCKLDGSPKSFIDSLRERDRLFIDSLKERDREQYRVIITGGQLEDQWEVFSTDKNMARQILAPRTELHRRLLNSPRLAFVLYSDDNIYFGGNYYFDLTKGTPEEVRANVEKAMDGLINEGVGTVLSGGMEYL